MRSLLASLKIPFVRFILIGTVLYLGMYFFYEFYINPNTDIDEYIIDNLVGISDFVLRSLGYDLTAHEAEPFRNRIGVKGSIGVFIGEPCDGFVLFALFLAFIVAYPGALKHKIWFIPLGILLIHLINALRVIALVLIMSKHPQWLSFNHDYTFTIIVYAFVFLLWWVWINKFSPQGKKLKTV